MGAIQTQFTKIFFCLFIFHQKCSRHKNIEKAQWKARIMDLFLSRDKIFESSPESCVPQASSAAAAAAAPTETASRNMPGWTKKSNARARHLGYVVGWTGAGVEERRDGAV